MWKHCAKKTGDISLHDCRATGVLIDRQDLYLEFAGGFWVAANTANNPYGETLRTGKSQLKISSYDISGIYVFKEIRLFRRLIRKRREALSLETLADNINSKRWELEFLDECDTDQGVLFSCWVWSRNKPCHWQCNLTLGCDGMECRWNELCRDKPW